MSLAETWRQEFCSMVSETYALVPSPALCGASWAVKPMITPSSMSRVSRA
ncbi:hypothetical protein ACFQYP_24495 [Nonomuraea antimicrobica]